MTTRSRIVIIGLLATVVSGAAFSSEVKIDSGALTLNGDIELADGKKLSDGVVILLHGTLAHKDMELISTLQVALQEAGLNSLAINLSLDIDDRHNFFPCDHPHSHRFEDALVELRIWRDWLARQGVDDVVLLGHSRGANQVAKYVDARAHNVRSAILLAPSIGNATVDESTLQKIAHTSTDGWLEPVDFLHCKGAKVKESTYLSYLGPDSRNDTVPFIEGARIPTLVISGSEDVVVPELAQRMAEIDNAYVTRLEIDGAGHFFRDLYAYDAVDMIVDFLQDTSTRFAPRLITLATSLQADGKESDISQRPIIVFVTQDECDYCQLLREQVLLPMIRAGELDDRVILRELRLDPGFSLVDFSGKVTDGLKVASRYRALVTPTLLFLDGNGRQLYDPLVGTSNIEYYEFYLNEAVNTARKQIRQSMP